MNRLRSLVICTGMFASLRSMEHENVNQLVVWAAQLAQQNPVQPRPMILQIAEHGNRQQVTTFFQPGNMVINPNTVNTQDHSGWTALMYLAERNAGQALRFLLTVPGINTELRTDWGRTALIDAISHARLEVVDILLQFPAINVNTTDQNQSSPLHEAVKNPDYTADLVRRLLNHRDSNGALDVNVNARDNSDRTPLDYAHPGTAVYTMLVAHGAVHGHE